MLALCTVTFIDYDNDYSICKTSKGGTLFIIIIISIIIIIISVIISIIIIISITPNYYELTKKPLLKSITKNQFQLHLIPSIV